VVVVVVVVVEEVDGNQRDQKYRCVHAELLCHTIAARDIWPA
jgi:hypothetical protein